MGKKSTGKNPQFQGPMRTLMEAMPSFVGGTLWKVGLSKCKYIGSNVLNS